MSAVNSNSFNHSLSHPPQTATVIEELKQFESLYRRQAALAEIELAVTHQYDLFGTLRHIVEVTTNLLPATGGASIILWDANKNDFVMSASTVKNQQPELAARRVRRKGGATRWIVDNIKPVVVPDIAHDPFSANKILSEYSLRAYVGIPIVKGGQALGVLYALDQHKRSYTEEDLGFLTILANRAAFTISHVRLYKNVQAANMKLQKQDEEQKKLIIELRNALDQVKTLSGLIPICSGCKKVRRDEGFWEQVEVFVEAHSEAEFSHSICPCCKEKMYAELYKNK